MNDDNNLTCTECGRSIPPEHIEQYHLQRCHRCGKVLCNSCFASLPVLFLSAPIDNLTGYVKFCSKCMEGCKPAFSIVTNGNFVD